MNPRKKPRFMREEAFKRKKVQKNWRKPRGWASKLRRKEKQKPKHPTTGFGAPRKLKGLHPSGHPEILVHNTGEIGEAKAVKMAKVGAKKKREIIQYCIKNKIKILNLKEPEKFLKKTEKKKKQKKQKTLAKPEKKAEAKKEEEEKTEKIGEEKKSPEQKTRKRTLKKK